MAFLSSQQLAILEFTNKESEAIQSLPPADQINSINKQYKKLAIKYHPDKCQLPDAAEKFKLIGTTKNELLATIKTTQPASKMPQNAEEDYFSAYAIEFPINAFDIRQRELIIALYRERNADFLALNTREKHLFAQQFGAFFALARKLEEIEAEHTRAAADNVYKFFDDYKLRRKIEWRRMILRSFGEESLDDFTYRYAIASGNLWPILAMRKVLSPIKIAVALCKTVFLILDFLWDDMASTYSRPKNLWDRLKIAALFSLFFLTPASEIWLYSGLDPILDAISNPINTIIRPLANHFHIHPYVILGITLCFLGAFTAVTLPLWATINPIMVLTAANYASMLYTVYSGYKVGMKLHELTQSIPLALGFGILCAIPIFPQANDPLFHVFLKNLSGALLNFKVLDLFNNYTKKMGQETELYPLPTEPASEALRQATQQCHKTSQYSHQFFSTPKEARIVEKKERTLFWQAQSFLGGGIKYAQKDTLPHSPEATSRAREESPRQFYPQITAA